MPMYIFWHISETAFHNSKLHTAGCRRPARSWIYSLQQWAYCTCLAGCSVAGAKSLVKTKYSSIGLLIPFEGIGPSTTRELWAGVANNVPHQPPTHMWTDRMGGWYNSVQIQVMSGVRKHPSQDECYPLGTVRPVY